MSMKLITMKKISAILISVLLLGACYLPDKTLKTSYESEPVFSTIDKRVIGNLIWSPNGNELAFTVFDPWAGNNEIYILDLNLGDTKILIDQDGVKAQSWSPLGSDIVYNRYREIWSIRVDGNLPPELVGSGQVAYWSPNGKQLAVFENISLESTNEYILKILDLENGKERTMFAINIGNQEIFDLSWSPDNTQLAFSMPADDTSNQNSGRDIYLYNLEVESLSKFTTEGYNYLPTWSLNGKQIAYLNQSTSTAKSSIIISQTGDNCEVTIPSIEDVHALAWSPDGFYLAYSRQESIYILEIISVFGESFMKAGPTCP